MMSTTRRQFLTAAGLGTAAAMMPTTAKAAPTDNRKLNVLLYVADDQGMNDAGCYGNPVIRTPGLDTLAREGVRFTHGFCTTPSCSPSRSVILTGLHNHATGQYGLAHARHHFASFSDIKSLPVLLGAAGYRTALAGKMHVNPEPVYHFEQYINLDHRSHTDPARMAEECRPLIADTGANPFFLYFCTCQPHRPFLRQNTTPVEPKDVIVPPYLPDTPECRMELAQYYSSVELADRGLVRLIEILRETGHWDDTLILYVSDNGIPFPGAKTNLYDPGIRLPCVARIPSQAKPGAVCDAMITWADITPTILDAAGALPAGLEFQGRSFLPAIQQGTLEGRDEVYASHTLHEVTMYYPMRMVRTRRYKLIWNIAHGLEFPFAQDLWQSATWQAVLKRGDQQYAKRSVDALVHRPKFELYDLEHDPDETHNLADDPAHADVFKELLAKIRAFQERTKDPWLLKWEHE
jgi:N-sulfoglucosamine sulfohydrolase